MHTLKFRQVLITLETLVFITLGSQIAHCEFEGKTGNMCQRLDDCFYLNMKILLNLQSKN